MLTGISLGIQMQHMLWTPHPNQTMQILERMGRDKWLDRCLFFIDAERTGEMGHKERFLVSGIITERKIASMINTAPLYSHNVPGALKEYCP